MMAEPTLQMPLQMSTHAAEVDKVYYFIYWLSVVLFVLIIGTASYFVWKYRRRAGVKAEPTGHHPLLEASWTITPIFILAFLFHWGFKAYIDLAIAPRDAIEVRVRGFQWGWDFEYSNGAHSSELRVPVNKPVKLLMSSADVLHSFFVPAFRVKKDLVPGMYTSAWFEATQIGETDLFCAEYCGGRGEGEKSSGHWAMISKVNVEPQDAFEKFLKEGVGPKEGETVTQWGERLYSEKNCKQCHSTDGSRGAGPSWKGIWGKSEMLSTGDSVQVDENYIRESILEPQAKLVQGFGPVMPTYKGILQDKEIDALIKFIQSLQ